MAVDPRTGLPILGPSGAGNPALPITFHGEVFPQVAVALFSRDAMTTLVSEVTHNLTANITNNVVRNVMERLKDRCSFIKSSGEACRIARAAHHCNDHDFSEVITGAAPSSNGVPRR